MDRRKENITIINDMMFEKSMNNSFLFFKKILPHKELQNYIEYFWISKSDSPIDQCARIIQDGCIYMLFLFDAEYRLKMNKTDFADIANAQIVGSKKHNTYFAESGMVNVLGIRFKPGGFFPLLKVPAHEFSESFISLEQLFGSLVSEIEEQLYESKSTNDKIKIIESFLLGKISRGVEAGSTS